MMRNPSLQVHSNVLLSEFHVSSTQKYMPGQESSPEQPRTAAQTFMSPTCLWSNYYSFTHAILAETNGRILSILIVIGDLLISHMTETTELLFHVICSHQKDACLTVFNEQPTSSILVSNPIFMIWTLYLIRTDIV